MPVFRVSPTFLLDGVRWQYDMWIDSALDSAVNVGSALNPLVVADLLGIFGTDCTYQGCNVADPIGKLLQGAFVPAVGTPAGTGTGTSLPPVACVCLSLYDQKYGRGRVGRWFLSGIPTSLVTGARLTAAGVTAIQGAFNDHIPNVNSGVGQVVIYSKKDAASHIVNTWTAQPVVREQRRREFGRTIRH